MIDPDTTDGDLTTFAESMGVKTVANTHNFNIRLKAGSG
jgi:hypothetical protein